MKDQGEKVLENQKESHITQCFTTSQNSATIWGVGVQTHEPLGGIFHPNDNRKLPRKRAWLEWGLKMANVWEVEKGDSVLGGKDWM